MYKRKSNFRTRRGATLVLVAVLLFVLGGMAAFALDLSRVYGGVNEIQTGADAAALAGARRLQLAPGVTAAPGTVSFAANNRAFGSPVSITSSDVVAGFWNPIRSEFTPNPDWSNLALNSVRVTVTRPTTLSFGRLLGVSAIAPRRKGTAWIANQASRDCIKPWGFPTSFISRLLGGATDYLTTQAGVNELARRTSTPELARTMAIIAGPNISNPFGNPSTPDTVYLALTNSNTGSLKRYEDAVMGLNCDGVSDYSAGGTEEETGIQPGRGQGAVPRTADYVQLTQNPRPPAGLQPLCAEQTNANDATCYAPGSLSTDGVTITIAATRQTGVNSASIQVLLGFQLMCVFRGGQQPGRARPQESCPWLALAGRPASNYVAGTLVGYPIVTQAIVGPGNTLGNTIGTAQKLVLVQ